MVAAAILFFGYLVMHLWNWLLPGLIGVSPISFLQALGIMVLAKILFGSWGGGHKGHCGCHHKRWHSRMEEKMSQMTPEEREKFKRGFGKYCKPRWEQYHAEKEEGEEKSNINEPND